MKRSGVRESGLARLVGRFYYFSYRQEDFIGRPGESDADGLPATMRETDGRRRGISYRRVKKNNKKNNRAEEDEKNSEGDIPRCDTRRSSRSLFGTGKRG